LRQSCCPVALRHNPSTARATLFFRTASRRQARARSGACPRRVKFSRPPRVYESAQGVSSRQRPLYSRRQRPVLCRLNFHGDLSARHAVFLNRIRQLPEINEDHPPGILTEIFPALTSLARRAPVFGKRGTVVRDPLTDHRLGTIHRRRRPFYSRTLQDRYCRSCRERIRTGLAVKPCLPTVRLAPSRRDKSGYLYYDTATYLVVYPTTFKARRARVLCIQNPWPLGTKVSAVAFAV